MFSSEEENTFKPSEIKTAKEDNPNRKSIEKILGMFVGRKSKANLEQHIESMELSNEKRSDSQQKKRASMFKTTGEQVGHLMFRKSAIVKDHEKFRKQSENHESFEKIDIQTYKSKEAQEFFLEPNEESEKEK